MTTTVNIPSDLANLTGIPNRTISTLSKLEMNCISSAVCEAAKAGEQVISMTTSLGVLSVDIANMNCKFVPSNEFKTILKASIEGKSDLLEAALEQSTIDRLIKICDEVL